RHQTHGRLSGMVGVHRPDDCGRTPDQWCRHCRTQRRHRVQEMPPAGRRPAPPPLKGYLLLALRMLLATRSLNDSPEHFIIADGKGNTVTNADTVLDHVDTGP